MSSGAPEPLGVVALDRCLACGGDRLRPLPFHYRHAARHFPAAECAGCGMRFLRVRPDAAGLARLYSADYFARDYRCGHAAGDYFASEDAFRAENQGLLDAFERRVKPGRMLEVGCAGGWLLRHARERGWEACGVELSAEAVRHARSLELDVLHGELASAGFPEASFDLVYMGDVLEHVPDCRATLAEAARVLRPGGILYLRGPIATNSLARRLALLAYGLAGRSLRLDQPPYHLWELTPGPLRALFGRTGFEVLDLRQSKVPPGMEKAGRGPLARVALFALDALNVPLTAALGVLGDRVTLVACRR